MSMPPRVQAKVAAMLRGKPAKPHVEYKDRMVSEVRCKACGTRIMGLIEHEKPIETVRENGKVIVTKLMRMGCLPNYAEIEIEFEDGSKHVTSVCAKCAGKFTLGDMDEIYAQDLVQFEDDTRINGSKPNWDALAARKPVGFKRRL